MKQLEGPVSVRFDGERVHIRIEAVEHLERRVREVFGPDIEIVYDSPSGSLQSRLSRLESDMAMLTQVIMEKRDE